MSLPARIMSNPAACVRRTTSVARYSIRKRSFEYLQRRQGGHQSAMRNFAPAGCSISTFVATHFAPSSFCCPAPVNLAPRHCVPGVADEPFTRANAALTLHQRLARHIRLLLRALSLLFTWSPVAVSGCAVALISRYRFLPEGWSTELREAWWTSLLKVK